MHINRKLLLAASAFPALTAGAANAQQADLTEPARIDRIVVTGNPFHRPGDEIASHVAILAGDELIHRREGTLGDTLNSIPGVHSDTFGAGASRPVIRGQIAPRVQVLSDGAAIMDASQVSPDHAITTEPLLLERIEILRGPSALIYGGAAIGGAVNLIDRRIPTYYPEGGAEGVVEVRGGTADDERAGVIGLTMGLPGSLVLRAEAAGRQTNDYKVPHFATRRVPGTFNTMNSGAVGLSWVGSRGYIGASYSAQNGAYGVPGHNHAYEDCHPHGSSLHCGSHDHDDDDHDHDHDHDHDDDHGHGHAPKRATGVPIVDLASERVDIRGEILNPFGGVEAIRFRGGYTDYHHHEIEHGDVESTFANKGFDSRLEIQHAPIGGFHGVIGAQIMRSDFEAFTDTRHILPESRTNNYAAFLFEEITFGDIRLEGAARAEWQDAKADGRPDTSHKPFSVSGAAIWSFMPGWSAALSLSRSQRAPSAQELYVRGIHLASNTYEIGDATLGKETASAVELTLRKTMGATTFSASAYHYDYDGYIYARTLDQFEVFRLIQYSQADARFTGIEGEIRHQLGMVGLTGFGDYVRGKLTGGAGNLPRIPAARLGARADVAYGPFFGEIEYYRTFRQDDIAAFETVTPGYDMVNLTLSYELGVGPASTQVFLRGTNLLDKEALNHASFLTNVAPLRGRNFVLGLRAAF